MRARYAQRNPHDCEEPVRRNLLAGLTTLAAALSLVFAFAIPSASAAPAATPASASTLLLQFNGVACVSATFCAGVGAQGNSAQPAKGNVPLAMIWTGTRWRETAVPLPKGWAEGQLDSVSCRSAAYCVATGEIGGGRDTPIAETWNGRAWTVAELPRPSSPSYFLPLQTLVSCAAVRHCVASGTLLTKTGAGRPFIDTLTGTKWTTRSVPLRVGATAAVFGAVDCVSVSYCVLAGAGSSGTRDIVLFESWNGKAFKVLKAASPAGSSSFPSVTGVSCVSAVDCVAVGMITKSGVFNAAAFAERWNGKSWSATSVFGSGGPKNPELAGVSCTSATRCVTVGVTSTNGAEETSHALAASYNGSTWKAATVPAPAGGGTSAFSSVSCVSATFCVAGGEGGGAQDLLFSSAAFTGFWNGMSWTEVPAS
jgi:hypothetical protein